MEDFPKSSCEFKVNSEKLVFIRFSHKTMLKIRLDYMKMSYKELRLYPLGSMKPLNGFEKEQNKVL